MCRNPDDRHRHRAARRRRRRRAPGHTRRAGRRAADADQSRLRVADRRRRQPQRAASQVSLPEGRRRARGRRAAAAAPAGRTGRPAERLQPRDAEHVRRQHPRSRAGHRLRGALRADRSRRRHRPGVERHQDGDRAHASRADAGRRRQGLSRLPGRPHRARRSSRPSTASCAPTTTTAAPATRRRADGRASSRATRSWSTPASTRITTSSTPTRPPINATTTFEGTYYLTADGTPEKPIVIKAAGDGEVDHRRPRQLQPVQRQGRRLQLLRGHHLQEHADRDLGRHAVHRRLEGADGEALPLRGRRHGRVRQLLGLERLLHRRQRLPRPQRPEAPDRLERRVLGAVPRHRGPGRFRR